ncbi:MAG: DNA recombination protein RmuC [Phycisphaerae bacterium]
MTDALLIACLVLLAVLLAVQLALLRRKVDLDLSPVERFFQSVERSYERSERTVRDEIAQNRKEAADSAQKSREELANALREVGKALAEQLAALTQSNEQKLEKMRETVEARLKTLQEDNARQIDQMRRTVDERLQSTLEKRLGESFKLVSERLEQVQRGLGEMQALATGVGDLKKVLTNVKTRGTWGEVQLGAMLEQVLTPEQFAVNVATRDGGERVEFAIRLPGRGEDDGEAVWLPIDAKFPLEDYQRLIEAQEAGDPEAAEAAGRQLELRVKGCARDICEKYINPPRTTDFGILFLPTEGLFAEVLRRTGLGEAVQREHRVVIAGPTTLWSILNSLQMGFKTLAIQKRSSEVWNLLSAVKTEWSRYGEILGKVQKKLTEASNTIEDAARRSRAIGRKLRDVQELPAGQARSLLLLPEASADDADDAEES